LLQNTNKRPTFVLGHITKMVGTIAQRGSVIGKVTGVTYKINTFFQRPFVPIVIKIKSIRIITFDPLTEKIIQWIEN